MWAQHWVERIAQLMRENREMLIDLDREIGDADHGENMDRGFREVLAYLAGSADMHAADILRGVGATLVSHVGGASGPLYGTAFIRMAQAAPDELTGEALAAMVDRGAAGIETRGRAHAKEKTMLDVWLPVADAVNHAAETGSSMPELAEVLRTVSTDAAQATRDMVATKGRASYLGERTVGHLDPGAVSSQLMFHALAEIIE